MESLEVFSYLIIITLLSCSITGLLMELPNLRRNSFLYLVIYICVHAFLFIKFRDSTEEITAMHKTEDSYYLRVSKGNLNLTKELYEKHLELGHDVRVEADYHLVTREGKYELDKESFEYYLGKKFVHIESNILGHKSIKD